VNRLADRITLFGERWIAPPTFKILRAWIQQRIEDTREPLWLRLVRISRHLRTLGQVAEDEVEFLVEQGDGGAEITPVDFSPGRWAMYVAAVLGALEPHGGGDTVYQAGGWVYYLKWRYRFGRVASNILQIGPTPVRDLVRVTIDLSSREVMQPLSASLSERLDDPTFLSSGVITRFHHLVGHYVIALLFARWYAVQTGRNRLQAVDMAAAADKAQAFLGMMIPRDPGSGVGIIIDGMYGLSDFMESIAVPMNGRHIGEDSHV